MAATPDRHRVGDEVLGQRDAVVAAVPEVVDVRAGHLRHERDLLGDGDDVHIITLAGGTSPAGTLVVEEGVANAESSETLITNLLATIAEEAASSSVARVTQVAWTPFAAAFAAAGTLTPVGEVADDVAAQQEGAPELAAALRTLGRLTENPSLDLRAARVEQRHPRRGRRTSRPQGRSHILPWSRIPGLPARLGAWPPVSRAG